jgi:sec-independent protein translocase protein TatC
MAEPATASATQESDHDERRMPFLEHLAELRTCLRNAAVAVLAATAAAYCVRQYLFVLLARPLIEAWQGAQKEVVGLGRAHLVFLSPHEAFMVMFKLSLVVGVLAASPLVFRELWRFISPGLYIRERRWGMAFVFISVVLFVGGAAFAYLYVLPASYKYFLGYSAHEMGIVKDVFGKTFDIKLSQPFDIDPMISMDAYLDLTLMLVLVFGAVFELPLILGVLAILGIVSGKQLWRWNRYAVVLFAVLGAFLTPGDMVVGQLAMTGSLTILYNLSILIAFIVGKNRREREAAEEQEEHALIQSGPG